MNARETSIERPSTVSDLMALEPIVIATTASLTDAARLMDEYDISGLPVISEEGDVVGVISQTDLVRARATEWLWANWSGLEVRHLMSSPPLPVLPTGGSSAAGSTSDAVPRDRSSWPTTTRSLVRGRGRSG